MLGARVPRARRRFCASMPRRAGGGAITGAITVSLVGGGGDGTHEWQQFSRNVAEWNGECGAQGSRAFTR